MYTPEKFLDKYVIKRQQNLSPDLSDGIFVGLLKDLCRWKIWDNWHQCLVRRLLKFSGNLNTEYNTESEAESVARKAIDRVHILVIILLLVFYVACFFQCGESRDYWYWSLWSLSLFIAMFRTCEILAVIGSLHLCPRYHTLSPVRAIVTCVVAYLGVVVSFAIGYLFFSEVFQDSFSGNANQSLSQDLVTPLYFSFVTVTTVGYGEFRPNTWPSKLLVMLHVFIGIIFIVIIIQRTIGAIHNGDNRSDQ